MADPCKECHGTGFEFDECEGCGRNGWVHDPDGDGYMTCPECDGESGDQCPHCEGTGEQFDE